MTDRLLAEGPPPLTETAADAALDAIDFIAATVRGIDSIDVTPTMRVLWRQHLAQWYPFLPPVTRAWYFNAPLLVAFLRNQWPFLYPQQQAALVQQWTLALPAMLGMLDPVLQQTTETLHQAIREDLAAMRERVPPAMPPAVDPETEATVELANRSMRAETLRRGSIAMTGATIDLMRAMSGR